MKFSLGLAICFFLATVGGITQQQTREPFAELQRQVEKQQGGWNGDKSVLSAIFDKERRQLGDQFEIELLKYIAGDAEKHYWISSFLEEPDYLHGNRPLPYLSLIIMEEGSNLLRDKTDQDSVGLTLSFNVIATVLSQKLGFTTLAISHKADAEHRLLSNGDWGAFFPAMNKDDRKLYDSVSSGIKSVRTTLPSDSSPDRPKTKVSAGVLNGRAKSLPLPRYPPQSGEVSGQVVVSIVFDETGRVIWAHAISGHPLLQKAAEDAAFKATFPPFKLEGKPEKVSGVLIYNFVK